MIFTVDDEISRYSGKQFVNNLIVMMKFSLSSWITSLMMSTLNDEDVAPAEIVILNTDAVTL